MSISISLSEMMPFICEKLASDGAVSFISHGVSMLPTIRDGTDTVFLKKPVFPLAKNNIILFKNTDGRYMLHRVIRCGKDSYTACGDNCVSGERGITDDMVIAVLSQYIRDGKTVYASSAFVKLSGLYASVRRFFLRLRHVLREYCKIY